MKKYLLLSLFHFGLFGVTISSHSQLLTFAQPIYAHYFSLKNAITDGDAAETKKVAGALTTTLQSFHVKHLSAKEQTTFQSLYPKLLAASQALAKASDLSEQRNIFQGLSNHVIALRKEGKASTPVYVAFCPMRKAYWLTREKEIRNPYYGSSMLNCGSIIQTIQ